MKKIVGSIMAAGVAVGAALTSAPIAQAAGGGEELVTFGDSYFADSANPEDGMGLSGCPQGKENPPRLVSQHTGLKLADYSCSGAMATVGASTVGTQVAKAIEDGNLGENTKLIPISIGGNDGIAGALGGDAVAPLYSEVMGKVIPILKDRAPNAEILLVGYPKMTDEDGNVCPIHVGGVSPKLPIGLVGKQENVINDYQKKAASDNGVKFVEMKESTAGKGLCGDDGERFVSGQVDIDNKDSYNMPMHLTGNANKHVAGRIIQEWSGVAIPELLNPGPADGSERGAGIPGVGDAVAGQIPDMSDLTGGMGDVKVPDVKTPDVGQITEMGSGAADKLLSTIPSF